jgi:hypothetical protein
MKASSTALVLAVALSAACATATSVRGTPDWVTALIQDLESQPVANPPAFIARYEYRGQTVYFLPSRCCDIPSNVYNVSGTIICHADGGLRGAGDGRCADFFSARKDEKIVWRDARGAGSS